MKLLPGFLFALVFALSTSPKAEALSITPTSFDPGVSLFMTFSTTSEAQIISQINANPAFNPDPTMVYKQNVGGSEEGAFASSYATSFANSSSEPEDATITYVSGASINNLEKYLLVKDGNQSPTAYLFNISVWNGVDTISLTDFWVGGGSISHVSLFTRGPSVPDGGATLMLLGIGLVSVIAARRLGLLAPN